MSARRADLPRLPGDPDPPQETCRMIRDDHAGEYGAVCIYAGQLAALGDRPEAQAVRAMAEKEKGKGGRMPFSLGNFHIQKPCDTRTHETKRFPGFGWACLNANSLLPTSDIHVHTSTRHKNSCSLMIA